MRRKHSKYIFLLLVIVLCPFVTIPAMAQKKSSDELLKKALFETNVSQNYPAAIGLAREGLKMSPGYTDIRILLGRLYLLTGKDDLAIPELRKALAADRSNKDALGYLINSYLQKNDRTNAMAYIDQFLSYYPSDRDMRIKKISLLFETDREAGFREIVQALSATPGDTALRKAFLSILLESAAALRKQEDYAGALEGFSNVLTIDPANKDAASALFNLSVLTKDYEAALRYALQVEKNNSDPLILFKRADLLKTMNRFDEASRIAERLAGANAADPATRDLFLDIFYSSAIYSLQNRDTLAAEGSYRKVIARYPADTTSRTLLINLNLTQSQYNNALGLIDSGLVFYSDRQPMLQKKLEALRGLSRYKEGYALSEALLKTWPENTIFRSENSSLFELSRFNRIGVSYSNTSFDQTGRDPWALYSLFYLRRIGKGSVGGRINYASRSEKTGAQYELEAYPVHGRSYSYVNAAFSDAEIFPKFRAAYSWFTPLRGDLELEAGGRYTHSDQDFFTFTAAMAKFFNRYWVNLKTYITPDDGTTAFSYRLSGRYYLTGLRDDYLTLFTGYGFSPDDRSRNFEIVQRVSLRSFNAGLGFQKTFAKSHIPGIFASWNNQEYIAGKKRNEFEAVLSYQYRF